MDEFSKVEPWNLCKCRHLMKFREVEAGLCGRGDRQRAWTRVRCSRCQAALEFHMTPLLAAVASRSENPARLKRVKEEVAI